MKVPEILYFWVFCGLLYFVKGDTSSEDDESERKPSEASEVDMMKAKCTGRKEIDWMDAFKEWFHIKWTDDPCKKYYEDLIMNPILLAPPHEALNMNMTMLITDPLTHLGEVINKILKVSCFILTFVAIICIKKWSPVSWFELLMRLFVVCFFMSVAFNWIYLYKIAFDKHQASIVKTEMDKCTRGKEIGLMVAFKEWFHIKWTCKDDPCKKYYEDLIVNPILLAPPHEALKMTITMMITDPLKHLGECINKFLKVFFLGQTAESHDHPPDHAA